MQDKEMMHGPVLGCSEIKWTTEEWHRASQTPPTGVFILSGQYTDEIQELLLKEKGESRFGESIDGLCQIALNFNFFSQ